MTNRGNKMEDVIEISKKIRKQKYRIDFVCPYCEATTTAVKTLTVPACAHFDGFDEAFGMTPDGKHVNTSNVVGLVARFTLKPNKKPQVSVVESCTDYARRGLNDRN